MVSAEFRWVPLSSATASHDITSRCHPRATEDHLGRPKRRPRAAQSPPGVAQGPPEGPLESPKTTKRDLALQEPPRRAPGHPGRAPRSPQERPGGSPPAGLQERFWSDFGPSGEHFGPNFDRCQQHLRGNLLLHRRGPRQSHAGRPNGGPEKAVEKAFQNVFQAICRPDVQSTCPTSCSSRPATVERSIVIIMVLISRSNTIDTTDDSFQRWAELRCG